MGATLQAMHAVGLLHRVALPLGQSKASKGDWMLAILPDGE
jgi:hypothetical protein